MIKPILPSENIVTVTPEIVSGNYILSQSHFKDPNTHYIIKYHSSLNGSKVIMPQNCTLTFIGGSICNGTIVGAETFVNGESCQIFGDYIRLNGSFRAISAKPIWFGIVPDCILTDSGKYLSGTDWTERFSSLLLFDNVTLDADGCYFINGHLSVRSNQIIDGKNATIKWFYVKHKPLFEVGYSNGFRYVENVRITNLNIIGNKLETDDVTEHCHGILIGYSTNVSIDNVAVSYCRGDGVYVGANVTAPPKEITPTNVFIRNVRCRYNHRQGMSITRVNGLTVKDSDFSYTSGTAPSAGIDIEPNKKISDNGDVYITECLNISISHCSFINNEGYGLVMGHSSCDQSNVQEVISNVEVKNCEFFANRLYVYGGKNVRITNSNLNNTSLEVRAPGYMDNILFRKLKFSCDIEGNELSAISFILYSVTSPNSRINNIAFENISINGYGAYGINVPSFVSKGISIRYINGLTLRNNKIRGCSVPLYIGPAIEDKKLVSNTLVPIDIDKLTPAQHTLREKVLNGVYVHTEE